MTHSVVTSKGQITIPKKIRDKLHLNSGDKVDFLVEEGFIKMIPLSKNISEVFGMLSRKSQKPVSIEEINIKLIKRFKKNK